MDHRLSRRGLLGGAGASLVATLLGACDSAPGVTLTESPAVLPPADTALATWELAGGFTGPGMLALRAPRLVVYGDGEAIADAAYRARLDADQLQSLASGLAGDLRSAGAQKKPTATPTVVDAPVTKVSVWSDAGVLSFSAEALDETKNDHLYADVLYNARDRLATVHKMVSTKAQPYLAARVRMVAAPAEDDVLDAVAWPAEVTMPAADAEGLRKADLDGDAARAVVRVLTRDLDQRGAWPAYRLVDGKLIRASWRYLLPNE
ncbi:hypothetical protein ACFFX1_51450 [Dactylosporangium sucinum]|uniref:hypothetical protein n=1 Tax=Dactylosporangium sucinum TaxID=1424081 RepID=UPI00167DC647|nr:hypothetical protein [Dactylosporangium sucinum]